MTNLLAVDFKRVRKDKLFFVMCLLAGIFALITPLLYALMLGDMEDALEMIGMSVNAKSQFFASFSLGNNFGLVAPVLLAIILCKDFNHGTIRNKIISGKTRTSIVLSMFTVCFVTLFGIVLLHALLTLGVSLIFFPYQSTPFDMASLGYFLLSLALELLLYLFLAALVTWLCTVMKNVGLVIVGYIAIIMVLTIFTTILQAVGMVLSFEEGNETALKVIEFFQSINVFNFATVIGAGEKYETVQLLKCILVPLLGTGALMGWSLLKFKRKDLK